jgi:glycosyltransferase involved in cell wall biosynthesis
MPRVSVVMAIWDGDSIPFFKLALKSLVDQVYSDFEVLIVSDGHSEKVFDFIHNLPVGFQKLDFKYHELKIRSGPAKCWNYGIDLARGEYIVRMDPDDVMRTDCISNQVYFMDSNLTIDVCGGQISEFENEPQDINRFRYVPLLDHEIKTEMVRRNTMNHVTVIMRKKSLGNLRYEQLNGFVDYLFWMKLKSHELLFANLNDVLVDVRVGNNFLGRRLGVKYAATEVQFFYKCYNSRYINIFDLLRFVLTRSIVRLMPKSIVQMLYKYLRNRS